MLAAATGLVLVARPWLTSPLRVALAVVVALAVAFVAMMAAMLAFAAHTKRAYYRANSPGHEPVGTAPVVPETGEVAGGADEPAP